MKTHYYVDAFVAAVPIENKQKYLDHVKEAANLFEEYGALEIVECWQDDIPDGTLTSFPLAVKQEKDESIVFSWVTWPSKDIRDQGMNQMMKDPRMMNMSMPFDTKRLIHGGFRPLLCQTLNSNSVL